MKNKEEITKELKNYDKIIKLIVECAILKEQIENMKKYTERNINAVNKLS